MKLLIILLIVCPIALIYLLPRYIKLREKCIQLEQEIERLKKTLSENNKHQ